MKYLSTKPYRGTRDFLPGEMSVRTQIFDALFRTVELFGFLRYDGPILEPSAIYEAKSGVEIVNEQMYNLRDKSERELSLRPEMTPTIARIIAGHQNDIDFPSRWYSHANCHRYERPQRGRVREHWQLNVDLFGSEDTAAEIEIFDLVAALMKALGASESMYVIRVNDRVLVEAALTNYVAIGPELLSGVGMIIDRWEKVDDDRRQLMLDNLGLGRGQVERLRCLLEMDMSEFCEAAGDEATFGSRVARIVTEGLTVAPLVFDPRIIRAFDYYTSTVFEVFDTALENRRSMFGGGRYDDLATLFTARKIPGIGFGMGDVTTWNFLESHKLLPQPDLSPEVFVFGTAPEFNPTVRDLTLRMRGGGVKSVHALEHVTMKKGLRSADRLGARYAVIIGETEFETGDVLVRDMDNSSQVHLRPADVLGHVRENGQVTKGEA